jgi:hypothetical protein
VSNVIPEAPKDSVALLKSSIAICILSLNSGLPLPFLNSPAGRYGTMSIGKCFVCETKADATATLQISSLRDPQYCHLAP